MIRRIVQIVAFASAFGACSSHNSNTGIMPEPGSASTSRADGGQGGRGRGGPGGGGQREEMALRGITLGSEQRERIDRIRASYRTQMEEARQQAGDDRAAMRERMHPMMEKEQAEVRAVLTSEQQAQYDRNIAEMRQRMRQGGGRRPNG